MAASTGLGMLTSKVVEGASNPHGQNKPETPHDKQTSLPFYDRHQGGIVTDQQAHTYFATFDLVTKNREEVIQLLKDWTDASAKLTEGKLVQQRAKKAAPYGSPKSPDCPGLE